MIAANTQATDTPTGSTQSKKCPIDILNPDSPNGRRLNQLREHNPKKLAKAIIMVESGKTYRQIRKKLGLAFHTIKEIKEQYGKQREALRNEIVEDEIQKLRALQELEWQKLQHISDNPEELSKITLPQISTPKGVSFDKVLLGTGQATQIVEDRRGLKIKDVANLLRQAKALKASDEAIDAEVSDVTPEDS